MARFDRHDYDDEDLDAREVIGYSDEDEEQPEDEDDGQSDVADDGQSVAEDDDQPEATDDGQSEGEAPVPESFAVVAEGDIGTINTTATQQGLSAAGAFLASSTDFPQAEGQQGSTEQSQEAPKRNRKGRDHGIVERDESGNWWWRSTAGKDSVPAILFTNKVRKEMIEDSRTGRYSHPSGRPGGDGKYDRTSFHPDQASWGPERQDRPDILFQYQKRPKSKQEREAQKNPGPLIHRGRVVLAPDSEPHRPVLDFPEIPMTLSSSEQGWVLEAMSRLNEFIRLEDFRDRMQITHRPDIKSLSMRRSRYRWSSGSLSWTQREGTTAIKDYLDKLIPEHLRKANTTKGFRDLEDDEIEKMKEVGKGRYPERRRKENKEKGFDEPPAEAGPSKKKERKKKARSRSRSRSPRRSQSPRLGRHSYRHRTPPLGGQGTGKGKAAGTGAEEEEQARTLVPLEERHDWREEVPETNDDRRIIFHALMTTRHHITSFTHGPTPQTDRATSYNDQWEELRTYFEAWWVTNGGDLAHFEVPLKHGPWWNEFPMEFSEYHEEHAPME